MADAVTTAASSLALLYSGSLIYVGFIGLGALFATAPLGLRGRQNFQRRPRFRGHRGHRTRHRRPRRNRGRPGRGRFRRRDGESTLIDFEIFDEIGDVDDHGTFSSIVNITPKHELEPRSRSSILVGRSGESILTEAEKVTTVNFARNSETEDRTQEFPAESNPIFKHTSRIRRNDHRNLDGLLFPRLPFFVGAPIARQDTNAPEEERILQAIQDSDTRRCGQRLVCELSGIRHRQLTFEESEILKFVLYGDKMFEEMFPGESVRKDSRALETYKDAARMGNGGEPCHLIFQSCSIDAQYMMSTIYSLRRL
ncbi:Protein of unknown function DM4/12 [Trinorchestia longiramus]|nr:Protein of unknown function DM4/12 [Trinorchestia longiramus]